MAASATDGADGDRDGVLAIWASPASGLSRRPTPRPWMADQSWQPFAVRPVTIGIIAANRCSGWSARLRRLALEATHNLD
jgi:hypothetical protein